MDEKVLSKMLNIAEKFFGTARDTHQIPITMESFYRLQRLHPKTIVYRLESGEPISWVVVLPTQTKLMEKFLTGELDERELLDMTKPQNQYEAIYLCAAFTVPEHRRKGHVVNLFNDAIKEIPHVKDVKLFAWPFSQEGRKLAEHFNAKMDNKILIKV